MHYLPGTMELPEVPISIKSPTVEKALDKLGDMASAIWEPHRIRRRAEAEGDAAVIKAQANARVDLIEAWRQRNIEAIARGAFQELPESLGDEPVETEFTVRFLEGCKDVGDEEMQSIWSQILAGELEKPGSYTYRTMEILKTMRRGEAEMFTRFCGCLWRRPGETSVYLRIPGMRKVPGADRQEAMHLADIGLVMTTSNATLGFAGTYPDWEPTELLFFDERYRLTPPATTRTEGLGLVLPITEVEMRPLSAAGLQLMRICGATPNREYLRAFSEALARHEYKLEPLVSQTCA